MSTRCVNGQPPQGGYVSILADCPWHERGGGKIVRGAQKHYALTKARDMPALVRAQPLWLPRADGCTLWMWSTMSSLPTTLWVITELGFRYVTHAVWVKDCIGLGQRLRGQHELLLLATRGHVPVPVPARRCPSVLRDDRPRHPVTGRPLHSGKPACAYTLIEAHDPSGPRAELFARRAHPGWDACGDQLVV